MERTWLATRRPLWSTSTVAAVRRLAVTPSRFWEEKPGADAMP
jgi:hypothetical protein